MTFTALVTGISPGMYVLRRGEDEYMVRLASTFASWKPPENETWTASPTSSPQFRCGNAGFFASVIYGLS